MTNKPSWKEQLANFIEAPSESATSGIKFSQNQIFVNKHLCAVLDRSKHILVFRCGVRPGMGFSYIESFLEKASIRTMQAMFGWYRKSEGYNQAPWLVEMLMLDTPPVAKTAFVPVLSFQNMPLNVEFINDTINAHLFKMCGQRKPEQQTFENYFHTENMLANYYRYHGLNDEIIPTMEDRIAQLGLGKKLAGRVARMLKAA